MIFRYYVEFINVAL